jgi:hypothetical protein
MASVPAVIDVDQPKTPSVDVPGEDTPIKVISARDLRKLGQKLSQLFGQYRSDRALQEERWLRNLRQYLGYYDPEVEQYLAANRSRAYPKITRTKCISMLSRIMDLMFPSDDRNWTITARPSPDMKLKDVQQAIKEAQDRDAAGAPPGPDGQPTPPPPLDDDYVQAAVMELAQKRADELSMEIMDQLQELGGDQSYDYVALNKEVVSSAILYGVGVLIGPYAREVKSSTWTLDPKTNQPKAKTIKRYLPQFEFLRCWDYYPDMSAKRLAEGDGYFVRKVMTRRQLRDLADEETFFGDTIKSFLNARQVGTYKAQNFETMLRNMGTTSLSKETKAETARYEVIIWHGPVDGQYLRLAGVEVPDDKLSDQIDAEVWMLEDYVIKAIMNPWADLGMDVRTDHTFVFDQDDTSPVGFGLPNIMRDTQMSISAATRMMLDNASVVCGPILEVNESLMRADQDLSSIYAYKTYYRDDDGLTAQYPAIREIKVESHIDELEAIIKLFMGFADTETFVSPMNGGDNGGMPSEPMRNAAGASMMFGHAALPFKDIIRNFDRFTQSVLQALVAFNRVLNPDKAKTGDYDVIARGATSLIAKEMRGMQIDQLATSLTPEERQHVDIRKLVEQRFKVRDLENMLVSAREAQRRAAAADAGAAAQADQAKQLAEANIRKLLSDAFKNIAQGQKNMATADVEKISAALDVLERGDQAALTHAQTIGQHASTAQTLAGLGGGGGAAAPDAPGNAGGAGDPAANQDTGAGAAPALPAGAPAGGPGGPGDGGAGLDLGGALGQGAAVGPAGAGAGLPGAG